jgi:bifunctional non-homologous end joining protein LigD
VRYLYAHLGGSIFQPVYLGVRDDIRAEECVIGQLKYKSQSATESQSNAVPKTLNSGY